LWCGHYERSGPLRPLFHTAVSALLREDKLEGAMCGLPHIYEIRPCKYLLSFDLVSKTLPFGRAVNFAAAAAAVRYAKSYSGSHAAVIRVYDVAGNVVKTHKHAGEFKKR
jgi:hypothetical protein